MQKDIGSMKRGVSYPILAIIALFAIMVVYGVMLIAPGQIIEPKAEVSIAEGSFLQGCEIDSVCYLPYDMTVLEGTTITWTNDDDEPHTVTSGASIGEATGMFDSGIVEPGGVFTHTFESAGTYEYHCGLHPWAKGVVIVR